MGDIPRHWRLKKQRLSLGGDYDPTTSSVAFPPGSRRRFLILQSPNGDNANINRPESNVESRKASRVPEGQLSFGENGASNSVTNEVLRVELPEK